MHARHNFEKFLIYGFVFFLDEREEGERAPCGAATRAMGWKALSHYFCFNIAANGWKQVGICANILYDYHCHTRVPHPEGSRAWFYFWVWPGGGTAAATWTGTWLMRMCFVPLPSIFVAVCVLKRVSVGACVCVSVGAGFAFLFWHPRPLEQRTYKARSVIPRFAHPKTVSNYVWKNYKKKKTREKKRRVAAHWIAMKKFLVISLNNKITVRENSKYFY